MLVKLADNLLVDLYEIVSIKKIIYDNFKIGENPGGRLDLTYRNGKEENIYLDDKNEQEIDAEFNRIAGLFQQMHAATNELGDASC
jgi:hypothetical protein